MITTVILLWISEKVQLQKTADEPSSHFNISSKTYITLTLSRRSRDIYGSHCKKNYGFCNSNPVTDVNDSQMAVYFFLIEEAVVAMLNARPLTPEPRAWWLLLDWINQPIYCKCLSAHASVRLCSSFSLVYVLPVRNGENNMKMRFEEMVAAWILKGCLNPYQ